MTEATHPTLATLDCGLNLTHFDKDWQALFARAAHAGVVGVIGTGTRLTHTAWYESVLKKDTSGMLLGYTLGVHPHCAQEFTVAQIHQALSASLPAKVLALGECGLDYYRMLTPAAHQRAIFETFLSEGATHHPEKAFFLHEREAHGDFLALLKSNPGPNIKLVHSFTGNTQALLAYLELGCYVSLNGYVTDARRNADVLQAMRHIPLNRLLLETDAPYLTPRIGALKKVRQNEPAYLGALAQFVWEGFYKHEVDAQTFSRVVLENTRTVFGLNASNLPLGSVSA